MIQTNQFNTFPGQGGAQTYDFSQIPSSSATARVLESQIYTDAFTSIPVLTHAEDAWTGIFPRPTETQNRRNYFGINTGITGGTGLSDDPEAVAVFGVPEQAGGQATPEFNVAPIVAPPAPTVWTTSKRRY